MSLWSLAAEPKDLQDSYIYLAKLMHKQNLHAQARRVLSMIGKDDMPGNAARYCVLKFDWDEASTLQQKAVITRSLALHAMELGQVTGFAPQQIPNYDVLQFPHPALARQVLARKTLHYRS